MSHAAMLLAGRGQSPQPPPWDMGSLSPPQRRADVHLEADVLLRAQERAEKGRGGGEEY